jgi:hypothetical protein
MFEKLTVYMELIRVFISVPITVYCIYPESIVLFKEGQAFTWSYNLAPGPPFPPLQSVSSTGDTQEDRRHEKERQLGEGDGQGSESYECKNACISSQWKGAFF